MPMFLLLKVIFENFLYFLNFICYILLLSFAGYREDISESELSELPVSIPDTIPVPPAPPISAIPEPMTNHNSLQLNLMTPDAFSSPVKRDSPASSVWVFLNIYYFKIFFKILLN